MTSLFAGRSCAGFVWRNTTTGSVPGGTSLEYFRYNSYGEDNSLVATCIFNVTNTSHQYEISTLLLSGTMNHQILFSDHYRGVQIIRLR